MVRPIGGSPIPAHLQVSNNLEIKGIPQAGFSTRSTLLQHESCLTKFIENIKLLLGKFFSSFKKKEDPLPGELARVQDQLRQANARAQALEEQGRQQVQQANEREQRLLGQVAQAGAQVAGLEQRIQADQPHLAGIQEELRQSNERMEQLQLQLQQNRQSAVALRRQNVLLGRQQQELREGNERLEAGVRRLEEGRAQERERFQGDVGALQQQLQGANEREAVIQGQAEGLQRQLQEANEREAATRGQVEGLQRQLQEANDDYEALQGESKATIEVLQQQFAQINEQVDSAALQVSEFQKIRQADQLSAEKQRQEIVHANSTIEALHEQMRARDDQLRQLQRANREDQLAKGRFEEQLQQEKNRVLEMQGQLQEILRGLQPILVGRAALEREMEQNLPASDRPIAVEHVLDSSTNESAG